MKKMSQKKIKLFLFIFVVSLNKILRLRTLENYEQTFEIESTLKILFWN